MWRELLPWLAGAAVVAALLGGSGRRRSGHRRRRSRRRRRSERFPREAMLGRIVRITDGDGLVADVAGFGRVNVRLAYVDSPEHDQQWGSEAKDALAGLLRHRSEIRFRLLYRDRYARAVAVISADGVVLNEELVRCGHAWAYSRYIPARLRSRYGSLESDARRLNQGLWGTDAQPTPPWEWRREQPSSLLAWLMNLLRRLTRSS